jgi:hypothetical protein
MNFVQKGVFFFLLQRQQYKIIDIEYRFRGAKTDENTQEGAKYIPISSEVRSSALVARAGATGLLCAAVSSHPNPSALALSW